MDDAQRAKLEETTRYDSSEVERRIFGEWIDGGYFHPEAEGSPEENFSVAIPPPNVTGALHMGHALNGSMQDALVRMNRMRGRNALWILGTDHAGIATQAVVEKELKKEGKSRHDLGREAFVERVWEWKAEYGSRIVEQYKRLGASCDYERERFTLDEGYVKAVYRVFKQLFDKGYIYRDNYMVNWDPGSHSAISDLEVENREVEDALYSIDYPVEDSDQVLTVATVRPETMLADTAVAVNPDDERYRDLVGKHVVLPLVGRRIPIIADDHVDVEFGTGALKITPGHDPNDFEIGRKHGLQEIGVIGPDGRMTEEAGEFAGMTAAEAQKAVVEALRAKGRLRAEEPYVHSVPFSHRSGERIEPLISLQWFCRMDELARPAIEVVERDEVRITPAAMEARLPRLDGGDPPLVHLPPALVGPPNTRLVLRRLPGDDRRRGRARALRLLRRRAAPGGGRARHLVQLGDLALRDPRLARRHPRAARLLPDQLPDHGAGDPLPLGGADDHDRARVPRRGPLPRRLRPLGDPGPRRAADVEEPGDRDRPAGGNRRPRRRRAALRPPGDVLDPGRALLRRQGAAGPRPRQQALECRAA